MLILGLLLIIVAVALTVGAVYDGGERATVELLGYDLSTTVAGVFFVGMATTALLLFGVWLMQASFGRARRRRLERKEAKARQRESVSRLEQERAELRAENERLAQKLERDRSAGTSADTSARDSTTTRSSGSGFESATSRDSTSDADPAYRTSSDHTTADGTTGSRSSVETEQRHGLHDGSTQDGASDPTRSDDPAAHEHTSGAGTRRNDGRHSK